MTNCKSEPRNPRNTWNKNLCLFQCDPRFGPFLKSLRYSFFRLLDFGLGKLADVRAARFQSGLFSLLLRCQWRGAGKFGGLRGFFPGSELVCPFPLLAFDALFVILVTYPCLI